MSSINAFNESINFGRIESLIERHFGRWNDHAGGRFYKLLECVLMCNANVYCNKLLGEGRTLYVATRQK